MSLKRLLLLGLLAGVFTVALTFATIEIPGMLRRLVPAFFPDLNPAIEFDRIEELLTYIRPIGYACIVAVIALTVVGFKTGKGRLSSLGSLALFLPTFGYYVASMFFLTGIGILRILWIPFWDVSKDFSVFKLDRSIVYDPCLSLRSCGSRYQSALVILGDSVGSTDICPWHGHLVPR